MKNHKPGIGSGKLPPRLAARSKLLTGQTFMLHPLNLYHELLLQLQTNYSSRNLLPNKIIVVYIKLVPQVWLVTLKLNPNCGFVTNLINPSQLETQTVKLYAKENTK